MFPNLVEFVENHLTKALEDSEIRTYSEYHASFRRYSEKMQEEGNEEFANLCGLLNAICSMYLDPDQKPSLLPFMSGSASPDNIRDEYVDVLAELMPHVSDAELKARIAEILWLRKRDYKAGDQAIEAYMATAKNLEETKNWETTTPLRIHRAAQIARELNRKDGLKDAETYLVGLLSRYGNDNGLKTYLPINAMRIMQRYKFAVDQAKKYAALAESGAEIAENQAIWHMARDYWQVEAGWHQLAEDDEESVAAQLRYAETYVKEAHQATTDVPPRHIAAHKMIEEAIIALRRIGGQQTRVRELEQILIEYGQNALNEMEEYSLEMDISRYVDQARNAIRGKSLIDALFTLAFKLVNVPSVDEIRKGAEQNIQDTPFRFMVSTTTFNDLGKTTARRTGGELDSEQLIREEMQQVAYMYREEDTAKAIGPAIYQINMEHNIRIQDIRPLVTNNPFVPSGREDIYARGLVAGLRDDGLVAAHLLIPQIENSLRHLLILRGKITSLLTDDLIQDEYPLSTILYESEYVLELEKVLGSDYVFALKSLLMERRGSNLRNLSAHGLIAYDDFSSYQVVYLTWLTLRLCLGPLVRLDDSEESPNV